MWWSGRLRPGGHGPRRAPLSRVCRRRRMRRAILFLVLGQTACAGARPEPGTLVPVPARFIALAGDTVTAVAPPENFAVWSEDESLRRVLEIAFRDAPSLAEATARVHEARALRKDAAWQLAPTVTGAATFTTE